MSVVRRERKRGLHRIQNKDTTSDAAGKKKFDKGYKPCTSTSPMKRHPSTARTLRRPSSDNTRPRSRRWRNTWTRRLRRRRRRKLRANLIPIPTLKLHERTMCLRITGQLPPRIKPRQNRRNFCRQIVPALPRNLQKHVDLRYLGRKSHAVPKVGDGGIFGVAVRVAGGCDCGEVLGSDGGHGH